MLRNGYTVHYNDSAGRSCSEEKATQGTIRVGGNTLVYTSEEFTEMRSMMYMLSAAYRQGQDDLREEFRRLFKV